MPSLENIQTDTDEVRIEAFVPENDPYAPAPEPVPVLHPVEDIEELDATEVELMPDANVDDWLGEADYPDAAPDMDAPTIEQSTLYGDVRDALLSRFRNTRKPWAQMSEEEQRQTVEAFGQTARDVVRRSVQAVTGFDFPRAVVELGQVNIKDKKTIEAKITCSNNEEYRSALGEAVGESVIILMVDSETFMSARGEPQIDKDQLGLDLDGEE